MDIVFHDLAKEELFKSRDYYDSIIFGLGRRFIDEFEKSLTMITEKPLLSPKAFNEVRKCNIRIFPFSIYYDIIGSKIRILAISHQKRKPLYWKKRK